MGILLAILIFSFIIFFHELGHFALAKKNGIDVEEFAIGMGPILVSKIYKGTRYCIKLFPIGGSCTMGEDEEKEEIPNSFNNKPVWARFSVIAAGPFFNFLLAFAFAVVLIGMTGIDKPVVSEVEKGYPAALSGIKAGDEIVKMGNKSIHVFREISTYNQLHQGEKVEVVYSRRGERRKVTVTPQYNEEADYYMLGVAGGENEKAGLFDAFKYGIYEVKYWICTTLSSIKLFITGKIGFNQLLGPVGIVDVVDSAYKESVSYGTTVVFANLMNIAILLSANLGVVNLLPFPALDGARIVFLLVEAVRKKRISPEKEGYVHFVGIVLLMLLMIVVMFNDIRRVFF